MKSVIGGFVVLAFVVFVIVAWPYNMYKLTECDFESDYKCEVMHGLGVIPALAPFTVWVGTDKE